MDDSELTKCLIKFFSYNDEQEHAKKLYEYHNREDIGTLKFLMFNDLKYGKNFLVERINTGFCFINNATMNIIATATYKFFTKYRLMIKKLHIKKFNSKRYISHYNRIIIGYDARPDSKRWAEIFSAIFYYHNWFVNLTPVPVTSSYVSFTAAGCLYNCGIMISGGTSNTMFNGVKIFFDDGCPMHPPYNKYLNELIREREFTPIKNLYELEDFEFDASLKLFARSYPLKINLNLWRYFKCVHSNRIKVLTVYCIHSAARIEIEAGLRIFNLEGIVCFYPPANKINIDILNVTNTKRHRRNINKRNALHPQNFFDDEIIDFAEDIESRSILIIGPEGMRCCYAYKIGNEWIVSKPEELAMLILSYVTWMHKGSNIICISTYLTSNFGIITAYKLGIRYVRLSFSNKNMLYDYERKYTLCKIKNMNEDNLSTIYFYFDEDGKFVMHNGREPSIGHLVVFLSGIAQSENINQKMFKIKNGVGPCSVMHKEIIIGNVDKWIDNVVRKRCNQYNKDLVDNEEGYVFIIDEHISCCVMERDEMVNIVVYFTEISYKDEEQVFEKILLKYFNLKKERERQHFFLQKKMWRFLKRKRII